MHLKPFLLTALDSATTGGRRYHLWMGSLTLIILVGAYAYSVQLRYGLGVTGMSDHVSWGLYISNFTFLVGHGRGRHDAGAAGVHPARRRLRPRRADGGRRRRGRAGHVPRRSWWSTSATRWPAWHLMPGIGYLNWPRSLLAWDVIVLNGYLALNLAIPFYILYSHYTGRSPAKKQVPPVDVHLRDVGGEHSPGHGVPAGGPAGPAVLEHGAAGPPVPGVGVHRRARRS